MAQQAVDKKAAEEENDKWWKQMSAVKATEKKVAKKPAEESGKWRKQAGTLPATCHMSSTPNPPPAQAVI